MCKKQVTKNAVHHVKLPNGLLADVVNKINQKLDQHSFVEWQSQQLILPRSRRTEPDVAHMFPGIRIRRADQSDIPMTTSAVHFSDPLFSKQWHLVSK
jgi:hypothetical protein